MIRTSAARAAETPAEVAGRVILREPHARAEVESLTRLYIETRYSRRVPTPADRAEAIRLWQRFNAKRQRSLRKKKDASARRE